MALREAAALKNNGNGIKWQNPFLPFLPPSHAQHVWGLTFRNPASLRWASPTTTTRRPGPRVSGYNPGSGVGARVPGQTARSQLALPLSSCSSTVLTSRLARVPLGLLRMNWHLPKALAVSDGTDAGSLALG